MATKEVVRVPLRGQLDAFDDPEGFFGGIRCEDDSLTQQSQAKDADINEIWKKFEATGMLPMGRREPVYGDFRTPATDFRSALELVDQARESFQRLPAAVRARFDHDPENLLAFLEDPANQEEAARLGLRPPVEGVAPPVPPKAGDPKGEAPKAPVPEPAKPA
ncbi:MAG: internal scaffolding protein [Microviridae sp.]|nr:MAG: internal scaffolding protein [Microviridae sp.]